MDWTRSWTQGISSVQILLCIHGALTTNAINISELARTKQSNKQLHLLIVSPGQKVISYSKMLQESVSNMVAIAPALTRRQMFLPTFRFTLVPLSWFFFFFFRRIRIKENMEREKKNLQWVLLCIEQVSKVCLFPNAPQFAAIHSHCMQTSS